MAGGIKVSEAKAAAAKVRAWANDYDGAIIPFEEIALVLRHYAQLTKPKVSNKGRYVKGRAFEYELRDEFTANGLKCRRVMQSGSGVEKDDLVLTTGWGEEYRLEAKRVAKVPAYLDNPQCAATIFRRDKGESLVLVPLPRFIKLCGGTDATA